jgi:hypothetical protein
MLGLRQREKMGEAQKIRNARNAYEQAILRGREKTGEASVAFTPSASSL